MTTMSLIPWLSSSGWLLGTFCFPGSLKIYKIANKFRTFSAEREISGREGQTEGEDRSGILCKELLHLSFDLLCVNAGEPVRPQRGPGDAVPAQELSPRGGPPA